MLNAFSSLSRPPVAASDQREDEDPLSGERGQVAQLPQRPAGAPREHGGARHRRRQPPPHPRTHLDHHPPLPGKQLAAAAAAAAVVAACGRSVGHPPDISHPDISPPDISLSIKR